MRLGLGATQHLIIVCLEMSSLASTFHEYKQGQAKCFGPTSFLSFCCWLLVVRLIIKNNLLLCLTISPYSFALLCFFDVVSCITLLSHLVISPCCPTLLHHFVISPYYFTLLFCLVASPCQFVLFHHFATSLYGFTLLHCLVIVVLFHFVESPY